MESYAAYLIERELTSLINRFSFFIDRRRYVELADLFAEDGVFDRLGQVLVGREALIEAMAQRHAFLTRHCVTNIVFTRVEADEAEATMYVANFVGQPETGASLPVAYALPQPALLEFDDVYRKTSEGWRIARRTARVVMKSEAAGH